MSQRWLRTEAAAERLNVKPATLVGWRFRNVGPVHSKIGRIVLYNEADLDAWVASLRVDPAANRAA